MRPLHNFTRKNITEQIYNNQTKINYYKLNTGRAQVSVYNALV